MGPELISIIAVIVQIIILIVFFGMASNIAKIRKQMAMNTKQWIEAGDMEAYAGNKEKARECYLKAKYRLDILKDYSNMDGENKAYQGMSRAEIEDKISSNS